LANDGRCFILSRLQCIQQLHRQINENCRGGLLMAVMREPRAGQMAPRAMMQAIPYPLESEGLWSEVSPGAVRNRPALFLDRDGVLVQEVDYLHCVADVALIPGAAATVAAANRRAIAVIVVTNQSGIGRGYYGWSEFAAVQEAIKAALALENARLDAVYACAYHAQARGTLAHPNHPSRKPNPGMLLRAASQLSLDLSRSWAVGDKISDLVAAKQAGLAGAMHVLTGYGITQRAVAPELATAAFDVRLERSIIDALMLPLFLPAKRPAGGP
jgi:D-glycero-D-manno-heptose 1,7-bisphosphate phosphatase